MHFRISRPALAAALPLLCVAAVAVLLRADAWPLDRASDAGGASPPNVTGTTGRSITLSDPRLAAMRGEAIPSPTEIEQWQGDRRERRRHREEWIESLHWAPPGTDWRAMEAANRRALALERYARIEGGERTNHWDELGSVNLAGRTHAAAPSGDGQHLYVGSNLGGVWRATIDGQDWEPLSDGLGLGSCRLAVAPAGGPGEPEVVLTLAAETIHASSDQGQTWFVPAGMPEYIYESIRVLHDPGHPRTVYYLARGGAWTGPGQYEYGFMVCRSTDGGQTFQIRCVRPGTPRCDIWIDRVDGGPLYLMQGNTLYRSNDGGATFQSVGSAPPASVADVILTGSEAGAPTFYAALLEGSQWKLYRSTNGGTSWAWRYDINDFWETLVASIGNPNLVFVAGVECWRSTNGGGTFVKVNNWWDYYGDPERKLHADLPGMDIYMLGGQEAIFFNTDGATYVSYDGGQSVQNISLWGLAISQYYSTLTSSSDPYLVAAGSQDQGYQQSTPGQRAADLPFEQLISGDYGHLTSTTRQHDWLYSVYPGFVLLQVNESSPQDLVQLDFPSCDHSWMPPVLADPHDADIFYLCGDHLWKYERDSGYHYTMTELPQEFSSGGGYLTALAISPADYNYWYAATSAGAMWYSHDAGDTWTQSPSHGPGPHYFYGTAIAASPGNREVAYAGGSGYAGHPVWKTTDGGISWQGMGQGLPSTLALGLALGGETGEDLFAACEAGPYAFDAQAGEWTSILGTEAPLTVYWCVEWVPEISVARFGTYGRGIWDYSPAGAGVAEGSHWAGPGGARNIQLEISPTPARTELTLRFTLAQAGEVRLELFDVSGRQVAQLARGVVASGAHETVFDLAGAHLAAGTYLARLVSGPDVIVRKVQVIE